MRSSLYGNGLWEDPSLELVDFFASIKCVSYNYMCFPR